MRRKISVKAELDNRPAPGERENAAMARAGARVLGRRKRYAAALVEGSSGKVSISVPHSDDAGGQMRLLDTFGTCSSDFATDALGMLATAMRDCGKPLPTGARLNAALAMVDGIAPANEIEAALAMQMAATHDLAMNLLSRTKQADMLNLVSVYGPLSVKLLRAFTGQVEALERLRRGGGQTVRVEHVHVHSGGQAIVGTVETGGRGTIKSEEQPHAKQAALAHADAPFDPLRGAHPVRHPVPVASHARRALPDARRQFTGRAARQPQRRTPRTIRRGDGRAAACGSHTRLVLTHCSERS